MRCRVWSCSTVRAPSSLSDFRGGTSARRAAALSPAGPRPWQGFAGRTSPQGRGGVHAAAAIYVNAFCATASARAEFAPPGALRAARYVAAGPARGGAGHRQGGTVVAYGQGLGVAASPPRLASASRGGWGSSERLRVRGRAMTGRVCPDVLIPDVEREERRASYPPVQPHASGMLSVGSGLHSVYWEESGNPRGKPVLFVHGGPGGGTTPSNRQFFDPEVFRIVLFDQRGCGKSTPHACLEENTTWDLVADMEALRQHLTIETWAVFGGSWGSTLSLSYAQQHPERVTELILRGIFMLRDSEIAWFYEEGGASNIFPDAWEVYRDHIPEAERECFVDAYHRRLVESDDRAVQLAAARAWTSWEMKTSHLLPDPLAESRAAVDDFSLSFARIENHYFWNKGFFETREQLLQPERLDRIRGIPTVIVQGRYDVVCPMRSAWDLHRALPEAQLIVVSDAGHASNEQGIAHHLITACDSLAAKWTQGQAS